MLMTQGGEYGHFLNDGLHLSEAGNEFLFRHLLATIRTHCPHLYAEAESENSVVSRMPIDAPLWDRILLPNPNSTFQI